MNITQCIGRKDKCLGENDCCYECKYNGWCEARCFDGKCRRCRVAERLGMKEKLVDKAVG